MDHRRRPTLDVVPAEEPGPIRRVLSMGHGCIVRRRRA
jgi:hypothetical protein